METEGAQLSSDLYEPQKNDLVDVVKDPGKLKTKGKVTFALQKNTVRNRPNDEGMLTLKAPNKNCSRCHLIFTFIF